MTAIVFPIPAAWVWGDGFLQRMGFVDFAGCSVVHLLGGISGLIGTYILGPRLGVFDSKSNNPSSLFKAVNMNQSNKYAGAKNK